MLGFRWNGRATTRGDEAEGGPARASACVDGETIDVDDKRTEALAKFCTSARMPRAGCIAFGKIREAKSRLNTIAESFLLDDSRTAGAQNAAGLA
mmetsp:Transcript_349/g.727  ORF Transcript_349/g.727 Transcript_349/m.727 type:complete len:95 (-) Transcript_349:46-330(-)